MTAKSKMPSDADRELVRLLAGYDGLGHIRVKRRGKTLTLHSQGPHGPTNHARLTWLGGAVWALSLPRHTGRWEKTPFMGTMSDLVQVLTQMLGFHLAPR